MVILITKNLNKSIDLAFDLFTFLTQYLACTDF
jgi:hypothetical protein